MTFKMVGMTVRQPALVNGMRTAAAILQGSYRQDADRLARFEHMTSTCHPSPSSVFISNSTHEI